MFLGLQVLALALGGVQVDSSAADQQGSPQVSELEWLVAAMDPWDSPLLTVESSPFEGESRGAEGRWREHSWFLIGPMRGWEPGMTVVPGPSPYLKEEDRNTDQGIDNLQWFEEFWFVPGFDPVREWDPGIVKRPLLEEELLRPVTIEQPGKMNAEDFTEVREALRLALERMQGPVMLEQTGEWRVEDFNPVDSWGIRSTQPDQRFVIREYRCTENGVVDHRVGHFGSRIVPLARGLGYAPGVESGPRVVIDLKSDDK